MPSAPAVAATAHPPLHPNPSAAAAPAAPSPNVAAPATPPAHPPPVEEALLRTTKEIYDKFKDVSRFILLGPAGAGKTWMAREISIMAMKNDLIDVTLWVYLNRTYDDFSLWKSIACQLCPPLDPEDNESEDCRTMQLEALVDFAFKQLKGKKLLLVLDDDGEKMKVDEVNQKLEALLKEVNTKILITAMSDHNDYNGAKYKKLEQLTLADSLSLLEDKAGPEVFPDRLQRDKTLELISKCGRLPAAIAFRAMALKHVVENESDTSKIKCALQEAVQVDQCWKLWGGYEEFLNSSMIDCFWVSRKYFEEYGSMDYNELISYWIFEGCVGKVSCVENAYEKGHAILTDLIDGGMLGQREAGDIVMERAGREFAEYHAGRFRKTELGLPQIFKDWHNELGEVIHRYGKVEAFRDGQEKHMSALLADGRDFSRILGIKVEDLKVLYIYKPVFHESLRELLGSMKSLEVLVLRDCNYLKENDLECISELSTLTALEISGTGSENSQKLPPRFFDKLVNLRVLNFTGLQIKSLPSTDKLTRLQTLILRRCIILEKLPSTENSTKLEIIDLSGASSFIKFTDRNCKNLELRMLDLSYTNISELPVLQNLLKLTHFLLRGCSKFSKMRNLNSGAPIEVFDLSGCSNITKVRNDFLPGGKSLISLDLSGTAMDQWTFEELSKLQYLYLRNCKQLKELPAFGSHDIKILDISDCNELKLEDDFFKELTTLLEINLTNAGLEKLPTSISHLSHLRKLMLCGCTSLKSIEEIKELSSLQILDVSDCCALKVGDDFFKNLTCLLELNLSRTGIEKLPSSISHLCNLWKLMLQGCKAFKSLQEIRRLGSLEVLNISDCDVLKIDDDCFGSLTRLLELDHSNAVLEKLPTSFSQLHDLRKLTLHGCTTLKSIHEIEALSSLQTLDVSGCSALILEDGSFKNLIGLLELDLSNTGLQKLPTSVRNLRNLRKLMLRGCTSLNSLEEIKGLSSLQVLDRSGCVALTSLPEILRQIPNLSIKNS